MAARGRFANQHLWRERHDATGNDGSNLPHKLTIQDESCSCGGTYDDSGAHYVWMAFLDYDNDEYRQEEWLRDYYLFPTNRITTWLNSGENSSIFHSQLFFWSKSLDTFLTFSVDAYQRHVYASNQKTFSRGWRFLRIKVTQKQERAMYDFLIYHAVSETPFNQLGAYFLFFRPVHTGQSAFFCSQLDTNALQCAGFLKGVLPEATSPAALYDTVKKCGEFDYKEVTHPIRTRQFWDKVKAEKNTGSYSGDTFSFH